MLIYLETAKQYFFPDQQVVPVHVLLYERVPVKDVVEPGRAEEIGLGERGGHHAPGTKGG